MTKRKSPTWELGALSPSKRGTVRDYILPAQNFPTPTRICNAAMPPAEPGEITKIMLGNTRPSSDRDLHPSRGGC